MRQAIILLALVEVLTMAVGQEIAVRERPQQGQLNLSNPSSPFEFVEESGKWVRLTFKGKPLWQYNYGVAAPPNAGELNATSGFLHPVWSLSGKIVTDWGPPDHYHHRGIFFAWVKTKWGNLTPDFWNLFAGSGRTRFEAFERLELHKDKAVMIVRHVWHAKAGDEWVPVVSERWTITTFPPKGENSDLWFFDLNTELVNISDKPLVIEEYRYGGLGFRGSRDWWETKKWEVLTAEGKTFENSDATDTRWVLIGGLVDGEWVGATLMDHPQNFNFPNRLRVNPGCPYVGFSPMRKTEFTMKPNEPMKFRFRILIHNRKPLQQELDAIWQEFAKQ